MSSPIQFGPVAADATERRELLRANGPRIDVIIRNPLRHELVVNTAAFLEREALIDTGASVVCIDKSIAEELALEQTDKRSVHAVGGMVETSVFAGLLEVPELDYKRVIEMFAPRHASASHAVLLGRSFLQDFIVTFNGPDGTFQFAPEIQITDWAWDG